MKTTCARTFIALTGFALVFCQFSQGQVLQSAPEIGNQEASIVDVDVARAAAEEMLPVFYEGPWQYLTHFVYYGIDDLPVTYAIVFSRVQADTDTVQGQIEAISGLEGETARLERLVAEEDHVITQLSSLMDEVEKDTKLPGQDKTENLTLLKEELGKARDRQFGMEKYATVFTGARNDMPLVVKCHQGLPRAFVRKSMALGLIQERDPANDWQFKRLLYLDRFTEAVEASQSTADGVAALADDEDMVVNLRTRDIERQVDLRQRYIKAKEARQLKRARTQDDEASGLREKNRRTWETWKQRVRDGLLKGDRSGMISAGTIHRELKALPVKAGLKANTPDQGTGDKVAEQGQSKNGSSNNHQDPVELER